MKDINIILEQIHNKSEINENAAKWGAALLVSGALGVAGANAVINNKRSSADDTKQTEPAQTKQAETQPTQTQPTTEPTTQSTTQPTKARLVGPKDRQIDITPVLKAIRTVETGGHKDPNNAVGDNGKALGAYQIWDSYWRDAVQYDPSLTANGETHKNVTNPEYAERVIISYMNRYAKDWTPEEIARIHNGGPAGATKRRNKTEEYYQKFKTHFDTQNTPPPTTATPVQVKESCGCKNKGLKSRMRKKIMQRLEEAILDLVDVRRPAKRTGKSQSPSPADIEDLKRMGLILDLGDTEQDALDTFNRVYGRNPRLERNPPSFLRHEPSAAQRGYRKQIDVQGTGEFQTRKPAIHINGFDTTVVPPAPPSFFGADAFELHSIHTLSDEQVSNPKHYKFTVTSSIATRKVDDKGNSYHPHAGQAIHTIRNHRGRIMAVFKGGHDRPLEQISINGDHWIQQSAGMILDPEEVYNPSDHDAEHAETAAEHPLFGRTERPEDRVSLYTQAIDKHLNAKVKMGLGIPLKRVRDVLAQHTDPREG